MKSLAVSEISSKASSSKSNSPAVTIDRVSVSLSPKKGDNPDNLTQKNVIIKLKTKTKK